MEMHQVRYFVAAARALSFTRAAEQCHVTQPALTGALKKLEAELAALLEADEIDAAIVNPVDLSPETCRIEALYSERYVVLLPPGHALRGQDAIALRDLDRQPYVDRLACEMRERVMAVCGASGIDLYARFRSEREDWVQAMVAADLGFAFMPEHSVTHPGTIQRALTDPAVERTVALASMPGRQQGPAVAAFMRAARGHRWLA
jgi:DNA-binding transcriptional LysR family regulator